MIRGLVVTAMFALGLAVGCSQQEETPASVTPGPASPTAAVSAPANDQNSTPPSTVAAAAVATVAPPPARLSGFVPLDEPTFLTAQDTEYFGDEELVLGLELAGEFRAYPVRMLRYHHIVNDMVGSEPLLVTY